MQNTVPAVVCTQFPYTYSLDLTDAGSIYISTNLQVEEGTITHFEFFISEAVAFCTASIVQMAVL